MTLASTIQSASAGGDGDSITLAATALGAIGAFLCGSVPFALLLGRLRGIDIRSVGSGNIGATNLGRALGRPWGIACFLLDALKGAAPVAAFGIVAGCWGVPLEAANAATTVAWLSTAIAAILGHVFSPWVGFKGGKGVSTGFGAMMALWPLLTWPIVGALLAWGILLAATRLMAVASIVGAATPPAVLLIQMLQAGRPVAATPLLLATSLVAMLVLVRHRGNLSRILAGTEPRIGAVDPDDGDEATPTDSTPSNRIA